MTLAAAHLDQLNLAQSADDWQIVPDFNDIVKDLKQIDQGLNVRFSAKGKCWAVFHRRHDHCPHNGREFDYLIRTMPARLSDLGVWTGLDGRVVARMLQVMPNGRWGYKLADELDKARRDRERRQRQAYREKVGEAGEQLAHALRRDLGLGTYRGRVFVPRDIKKGEA